MTAGPLVLGTAGHVDHGKTALVLALTGRDTDRLPEEKARGISIALGFASLCLPSGRLVSLVDVPGHERFVRHMVAGASGVDGYLLCVAADDGVMPQTVEHLAVLRLLGVEDGVVAVTKADLADPARASAEARELVGDGPEIVAVSAPSGAGVEALGAALDRLAGRLMRRTARGGPRLFVDRAFSVAGAGTIVTGTLWGDGLAEGDRVDIVPGGRAGRVRRIEVHDSAVGRATGGRVALNIAGIDRGDAPRGACVVRHGDGWRPSRLLDVAIDWLADAGGPLRSRRRLQAFLGTAEVPATCVLLDRDELAAGQRGYAQLRIEVDVVAAAGDRIVLRSAESRTVGGARVIDPAPQRHGKGSGAAARLGVIERGDPAELLALRIADAGAEGIDAGGVDRDALETAGAVVLPSGRAVEARIADRARVRVVDALAGGALSAAAAHAATGLGSEAAAALIDAMVGEGTLDREGARLTIAGRNRRDPSLDRVLAALDEGGMRPPGVAELSQCLALDAGTVTAALVGLRDEGAVVAAGDAWFAATVADDARRRAAVALASGPMSLGELRDLWGVGRRHALALAAHLDASGLTRRVGDRRMLRRGARSREG